MAKTRESALPKNRLTSRTWVPLYLAVIVIGGGSGWITKTTFQLSDLNDKTGRMESAIEGIKRDVTRIKALMEVGNGVTESDDADTEYGSRGDQGQDFKDLPGYIRQFRTQDEGYVWPPLDVRTEEIIRLRTG